MELSRDAVDNAVMVIDGGKDDKALCMQVRETLSRKMKAEGYDYRLSKVRPYRSHRSDGVMVADMLSGAARHTAQGKAPDFLAALARKIMLRNIPKAKTHQVSSNLHRATAPHCRGRCP